MVEFRDVANFDAVWLRAKTRAYRAKKSKKKCVPITFLKTAVRRLEEILTGVEKKQGYAEMGCWCNSMLCFKKTMKEQDLFHLVRVFYTRNRV